MRTANGGGNSEPSEHQLSGIHFRIGNVLKINDLAVLSESGRTISQLFNCLKSSPCKMRERREVSKCSLMASKNIFPIVIHF